MKKVLVLVIMVLVPIVSEAQKYVETFDQNIIGWTECAFESSRGSAEIGDGFMTVKSKGENRTAEAIMSLLTGIPSKYGEDTFFETHCYAPLDVKRPFEIISKVNVGSLSKDKLCGLIFNYRDGGNFYWFNFNDEMVNFTRFVDNRVVGNVSQGVRWPKKKKVDQIWRLKYDGDVLSFYVDDLELLKVRYMPVEYSGIGFCTYGKQTLKIDEMTFIQN